MVVESLGFCNCQEWNDHFETLGNSVKSTLMVWWVINYISMVYFPCLCEDTHRGHYLDTKPGNDIRSPLSDVRAHRLSNDPTYLQTSFSAIVSSPHSDNSIKYAKEIKTALNSKLYKEYHDGCVSPHPCRPHGLIPLLFPCILVKSDFLSRLS